MCTTKHIAEEMLKHKSQRERERERERDTEHREHALSTPQNTLEIASISRAASDKQTMTTVSASVQNMACALVQ